MTQSVTWLNQISRAAAQKELLKCCGSKRWAQMMTAARPFANAAQLFGRGDEIWWSLSKTDWLEAFRAHPKIGEQTAATAQTAQVRTWSAQEQSGMTSASSTTVEELAQKNSEYQERFGFIFIVCATGKSSEEMLDNLKTRLSNPADVEIRVAAEEQNKITRLRLERLLSQ